MACYGIHGKHAIVDCPACNGIGHLMVLHSNFPPMKEDCKICDGRGIVRIPVESIKVMGDKEESEWCKSPG
jgi:DnaJ-class molecular chaperone